MSRCQFSPQQVAVNPNIHLGKDISEWYCYDKQWKPILSLFNTSVSLDWLKFWSIQSFFPLGSGSLQGCFKCLIIFISNACFVRLILFYFILFMYFFYFWVRFTSRPFVLKKTKSATKNFWAGRRRRVWRQLGLSKENLTLMWLRLMPVILQRVLKPQPCHVWQVL